MATYPIGVRPLLAGEAARRRAIEGRLVAALESAGYAEIILPIIDFASPYADLLGEKEARQSYRFVDREGELVAIRSDFTPMVARALAPVIAPGAPPLRVFYRGDVIRCDGSRLGASRGMFQVGAEIVGDASVDADVEALRLAASLARAAGSTPLLVCTDVAGGDERLREIERRLADELPLERDELREQQGGYYTGLRFRAYCSGTGSLVGQGGRYDDLYGHFGCAAPAVGFTFTIDEGAAP